MTFQSESISVNNIPVTMLTAGSGSPLLVIHGAGTSHGFDHALTWAETHRVLIPMHPGWSTSGDAEWMTTINDFRLHYLDLIDQLGLTQIDIVGHSLGGRIAAAFATEHRRRVRRLVLVSPAGLSLPGYGLPDFSKMAPDQILDHLTTNVPLIASRLPNPPSPEWLAERGREAASFGRVFADMTNAHFTHWLHRVTMPSMLVWGAQDRTTPIQQADEWRKYIPGIQFVPVPGAGHLVLEERPKVAEMIGQFLNA